MKSFIRYALSVALFVTALLSPTACKRIVEVEVKPQPEPPIVAVDDSIKIDPVGDVVLQENVFILDAYGDQFVKEVKEGTIVFDGQPRLKAARVSGTFDVNEIREGHVIVAGITDHFPNGLLIKAKNVIVRGSEVIVEYTQAAFTDLFKDVDTGYFTIPMPGSITELLYGTPTHSLELPFNFGEAGSVSVGLRDYKNECSLMLRVHIVNGKLEEYFWQVIEESSSKITVEGVVNTTNSEATVPIFRKALAPKPFKIGPIPGVFRPCVLADLKFSMTGKVSGTATIADYDLITKTGKVYKRSNGFVGEDVKSQINAKPNGPTDPFTVQLSGKYEAALITTIETFFYNLAPKECFTEIGHIITEEDVSKVKLTVGGRTNLTFGLEADCKVNRELKGKLYWGFNAELFGKLKVFDYVEVEPKYTYNVLGPYTIKEWKDNESIPFCRSDEVQTDDAALVTASSAQLNGTILSFGQKKITHYGFLVGTDPANLTSSAALKRETGELVTRDKLPYAYAMPYTFSGPQKRYFQAFIQAEDGTIFKGEVKEFTPARPDVVPDDTEPVPTSISTGDPHITTLDGARYSFQAAGEFVALKSTTDKFEVQARQQEVASKNNSGQVSFNTGLAVHTGNDVVCIYPPNRIFVNKQPISFDFENYALSGGGSIRKDFRQLYIRNGNGDQVEVRLFEQDLDFYMTLNANRRGKIRGLNGNYDGNAANDLVTSSGQAVPNTYQGLYPNFSDSWRIKQAESLFTYDSGKNTETYTDRSFPKNPVSLTASQEAAARSICAQQGVTDPITLQNCIVDVALTGDRAYAERAEISETNGALRNFSIGNFNNFRNDIGLYEATLSSEGVRFNDLNCSGTCSLPAIYWKEKLDFSKGFETEVVFTASKVVANANDNSLGVCGIEAASSSSPSVYSALLSGAFDASAQKKTTTRVSVASGQVGNNGGLITNIFDGQRHKIRIVVSRAASGSGFSGSYRMYLDGAATAVVSGNFTQSQYFRNMLFPSLYGENVLVHSWTMKSLM